MLMLLKLSLVFLLRLVVEGKAQLLRILQELLCAILVVICRVLLLQVHHEVVVIMLRVHVTRQRLEVLVIVVRLELFLCDASIR